jgi:hypothetical protein
MNFFDKCVILCGYLFSATYSLFFCLTWYFCYYSHGRLLITIGTESYFELLFISWLLVLSFTGLFLAFKWILKTN